MLKEFQLPSTVNKFPLPVKGVAEGVGFEPTVLSYNGFQDRRLKPLGHPSFLPGTLVDAKIHHPVSRAERSRNRWPQPEGVA